MQANNHQDILANQMDDCFAPSVPNLFPVGNRVSTSARCFSPKETALIHSYNTTTLWPSFEASLSHDYQEKVYLSNNLIDTTFSNPVDSDPSNDAVFDDNNGFDNLIDSPFHGSFSADPLDGDLFQDNTGVPLLPYIPSQVPDSTSLDAAGIFNPSLNDFTAIDPFNGLIPPAQAPAQAPAPAQPFAQIPIQAQDPVQAQTPARVPIFCLQPNCWAIFNRDTDRIRHEQAVHGINRLLYLCPIPGCVKSGGSFGGYTRKDKVTEHLWKKHANLGYTKRV